MRARASGGPYNEVVEPNIRYATTADGVSIAYWTMGEGEPLLELQPPPFNDIEHEWREWEFHRLVARHRQLIRYDCRGSGSSQRSVADFSIEALVNDVEAVVDALGLEHVNIWGEVQCAPTAIGYAVRHPERVARLVLYAPIARPADFYALPTMRSLLSLLDQDDWITYTDSMALAFFGWEEAAAARDMATYYRGCTDTETAKRCIAAQQSIDVTGLLGQVRAPSLIIYPRGATFPTVEMARRFASGIRDARVSIIESAGYWTNEATEGVLRLLDEFLGERVPVSRVAAKAAGGEILTPEKRAERPAQTLRSPTEAGALTPRETEVLRLIAAGRTNREIAADLTLSVRTVARHITNIYTKIGARGKADATSYAHRNNLT